MDNYQVGFVEICRKMYDVIYQTNEMIKTHKCVHSFI